MVEIHSGTQNVRVRLSGGSMLFIASYIWALNKISNVIFSGLVS